MREGRTTGEWGTLEAAYSIQVFQRGADLYQFWLLYDLTSLPKQRNSKELTHLFFQLFQRNLRKHLELGTRAGTA